MVRIETRAWSRRSVVVGAAALPLLTLFSGSAPGAVFQNGSFETNTGAAATGWSNTGVVGFSSGEGSTDGTQAANFNGGDQPPDAVLWQTFDTIASLPYSLTFDFGKYATGGTISQRLQIEVRDGSSPSAGAHLIVAGSGTVDGGSGGSILSNTNTPLVQDSSGTTINLVEFSEFTFTFIPTSATSTLVFRDQSTGTSGTDGALDSVVITAIPEPASLLALAAPAALALFVRDPRRR
jgi:hypothetical protein